METIDTISLAPLVEALQDAHNALVDFARESEGVNIPRAVVTVAGDDSKGSRSKYGHFTTNEAWQASEGQGFHEILITGEGLTRGAVATFGTLAHETAHLVNNAQGVKDTDTNGRHNKKFKATAERLFGLTIEEGKGVGWSVTTVSPECQKQWQEVIDSIEAELVLVRSLLGGASKPKGRNKNLLKAVCDCGDSIRASAKVIAKGVTCDECESHYKVEGGDES
jgi:hypothetical protein